MTTRRFLSMSTFAGLALALALWSPLTAWASGAWVPVGSTGFSGAEADYLSLALDSSGTP